MDSSGSRRRRPRRSQGPPILRINLPVDHSGRDRQEYWVHFGSQDKFKQFMDSVVSETNKAAAAEATERARILAMAEIADCGSEYNRPVSDREMLAMLRANIPVSEKLRDNVVINSIIRNNGSITEVLRQRQRALELLRGPPRPETPQPIGRRQQQRNSSSDSDSDPDPDSDSSSNYSDDTADSDDAATSDRAASSVNTEVDVEVARNRMEALDILEGVRRPRRDDDWVGDSRYDWLFNRLVMDDHSHRREEMRRLRSRGNLERMMAPPDESATYAWKHVRRVLQSEISVPVGWGWMPGWGGGDLDGMVTTLLFLTDEDESGICRVRTARILEGRPVWDFRVLMLSFASRRWADVVWIGHESHPLPMGFRSGDPIMHLQWGDSMI
ncbi:hypothetical protein GMORB2_6360 [Geosmithia morbida]|uniref:Uncharacterized protein n=1 Tax=Geosmithia morbida TaxID=1094350 RepID=A0A9P4YZ29_9HYPO|nr:uncharacterized protein GMORB2_6360 [Geosmithia morbida]KAF4123659.1 hypothetical protein GMORB2_6360 [Geosmithia morbida]